MSNVWRTSFGPCFVAAAGMLVGCGGYSSEDNSAPVTEEASALVAGATNVSDGIQPNSIAESETAAIGIGSFLAVAYNSVDLPTPGERCFGNSVIGMSYRVSAWQGLHFSTPPGVALLRGDPSIGGWDNGGNNYTIFVSTLAHSAAQWNTLPKQADGCISHATYDDTLPDELCIITVSEPKAGGTATVTGANCMSPGTAIDGTALTVNNGTPYVSSWNGSGGLVFFRGDGTRLPAPLASHSIVGHPIFTKNTNLQLFAPDAAGKFWTTSYNISTGAWGPESSVPSAFPFQWGGSLPFGMRGGKDYSAAYLPGSAGPGLTLLFFRDSRGLIVGYGQSTSGNGGAWTLEYTSTAGVSAFHPAAEVAAIPNQFPPYTGFHVGLSYWDTSGGSGGSAALKFSTDLGAASTIASETPCPHNGYWGDYDEMAVLFNNTQSPTFRRYFTDSTKSACLTDTSDWSTNTPQHVSGIGHLP